MTAAPQGSQVDPAADPDDPSAAPVAMGPPIIRRSEDSYQRELDAFTVALSVMGYTRRRGLLLAPGGRPTHARDARFGLDVGRAVTVLEPRGRTTSRATLRTDEREALVAHLLDALPEWALVAPSMTGAEAHAHLFGDGGLFSGLRFVAEVDRVHLLALALTPMVAPLFDGASPLGFCMGEAGSGKTQGAIDQIAELYDSPAASPLEGSDPYFLAGLLAQGVRVVALDNVSRDDLLSDRIRSLVTKRAGKRVYMRTAGTGGACLTAPELWLASGLGLAPDPETGRRVLPVRLRKLEGDMEAPTLDRARTLDALLSLVVAWEGAGRPGPPQPKRGFPAWSSVAGGIACHALPRGASDFGQTTAPDPAGDGLRDGLRRLFDVWPRDPASSSAAALRAAAVGSLIDDLAHPALHGAATRALPALIASWPVVDGLRIVRAEQRGHGVFYPSSDGATPFLGAS